MGALSMACGLTDEADGRHSPEHAPSTKRDDYPLSHPLILLHMSHFS